MIILASSSPRRRALLKKAGIRFRVMQPSYRERDRGWLPVVSLTKRHALGKALSVASGVRDGIVLGADTVVTCDGRIAGKPRTMKHAERMLGRLQGRWQDVVTGVALVRVRGGRVRRRLLFYEKTKVRLRKMDEKEIRRYFRRVNPLDKPGAYALQAGPDGAAQRVRGSWSNAVGLPMEKLKKFLRMLR